MRSVDEVARQMFAGLHHDCHGCDEGCCCDCYVDGIMPAVVKAIARRDAEVRTAALAEFEREDHAPFHGHGFTDPGYWRLVGPKHYKPLPPPPTDAEVRAMRERFGLPDPKESP